MAINRPPRPLAQLYWSLNLLWGARRKAALTPTTVTVGPEGTLNTAAGTGESSPDPSLLPHLPIAAVGDQGGTSGYQGSTSGDQDRLTQLSEIEVQVVEGVEGFSGAGCGGRSQGDSPGDSPGDALGDCPGECGDDADDAEEEPSLNTPQTSLDEERWEPADDDVEDVEGVEEVADDQSVGEDGGSDDDPEAEEQEHDEGEEEEEWEWGEDEAGEGNPHDGIVSGSDPEEEQEPEELSLHFDCSVWTRDVWMACLKMSSCRSFPSDLVRCG